MARKARVLDRRHRGKRAAEIEVYLVRESVSECRLARHCEQEVAAGGIRSRQRVAPGLDGNSREHGGLISPCRAPGFVQAIARKFSGDGVRGRWHEADHGLALAVDVDGHVDARTATGEDHVAAGDGATVVAVEE